MSEVTKKFDRVKQALEKAEKMGKCLTEVLTFVDSKGLGEELMQHMKKIEDPYFLMFLRKVNKP